MVRIKTNVSIGGVDVTSKVHKWKYIDAINTDIPDMLVRLSKNVDTLATIENGQEIIVKRGSTTGSETTIFTGFVDTVDQDYPFIVVKAKNKLIQLVRRDVNKTFDKNVDTEAGVGSEIALTLITTFGGLTADSGTVVSTGTAPQDLIDKFPCRKTDIFERLMVLKDVYEYQLYYDYSTDKVHFEPLGFTTNTNTITIKGNQAGNIPVWKEDNTQLINQVRVEGAEQQVETTESGTVDTTAGYTTTEVQLTKSPFSVKVFVDSGGGDVLKTGGEQGSTSAFDYSVDEELKQVVWNTATFSPSPGDVVTVQYTYPVPRPVLVKRDSSITQYGLSSTVKHFSDIKTVEDARRRGNLYLDLYAEPFLRTMVRVPAITSDYTVGEKVRVIDDFNGRDETLVINKIVRQFPHQWDEIHLGDKEYSTAEYNRLVLDKIKRLEEIQAKNDDLLIQIFENEFSIGLRPTISQIRQIDRSADDVFTLGHKVRGVMGSSSSPLGSFTSASVESTIRSLWPTKRYTEDFKAETFLGNGTATVDTAEGILE